MGYKLNVERAARLVRVCLFGKTSVDEHRQWLRELVNHPDWSPDFDVLVDVRELGDPNSDHEQVRAVAQYAKQLNERLGTGRHAVVGDTDLLYGYCRMAEQLCFACPRELVVFRDMSEAERWLGIGETKPSPHSGARLRKAQAEPKAEKASGGEER
jgi:hypothetical protein